MDFGHLVRLLIVENVVYTDETLSAVLSSWTGWEDGRCS